MDRSTRRKVALKAEAGTQEEDGAEISFTEIDIDLPDIKEECLERSTLANDCGLSNTKSGDELEIESQQNWCPEGFKMSQSTAKLPTVRFSADEDERLIEFVRNHAILYDMKDLEFKNTPKKDLIWNEAGKLLQKEGNQCKKRWQVMRALYSKEKKDSTRKAAKKKRALYSLLQFLDTTEDERNRFTNVLFSSDNETSTLTAPTDIIKLEEEEDVPPEQAAQGSSHQGSAQQTHARNTTPSLESQGSNTASFRRSKSKIRKEKVMLPQLMKDRRQDREHFKRCLEELAAHPGPQENENEIDLFFKTMAATVKRFRPEFATQTKASVFKVVTEMEVLNQQSPFPRITGFTSIRYNENQSPYSSSSGSSSS